MPAPLLAHSLLAGWLAVPVSLCIGLRDGMVAPLSDVLWPLDWNGFRFAVVYDDQTVLLLLPVFELTN